ncbi:hypothetical protein FRC02_010939 [Tulasnella sp. 418]|nr:hypothetical protein FRC02_010939 [Tulasnella sp. 418]
MVTQCGFSVTIHMGGVDLPEYGIEQNHALNTTECYVPSQAGKEYAVLIKRQGDNGSPVTHVKVKLYLDGVKDCVARPVLSQNRREILISSVRDTDTSVRPFLFDELQTTDDNFQVTAVPAKPGCIRIELQRILLETRRRQRGRNDKQSNSYSKLPEELTNRVVVHETHKKAGGIKSSFGPPRQTASVAPIGPPSEYEHYTKPYSKEDEKPFVCFTFYHRTEAMLKAQGIMPHSRSSSVVELSDGDLSDKEDIGNHNTRIRELEEKQAQLDAERITLNSQIRKGKRKRSPAQVKEEEELRPHRFFKPGEVVDMTHL